MRKARISFRILKNLSLFILHTLGKINPLQCAHNKGGWRTDFCDYLERKANENIKFF